MSLPRELVPLLVTTAVAVAVLAGAVRLLRRRSRRDAESDFRNKLVMLGLSLAALVALLVAAPIRESTRGQLLGFLGIVLSASLALSSTTILGNALAGLMMRAVGAFRVGDFVRVEDQFGRVTERGLFHTEIQTEDRDLVTLPNLYLATHPVRVLRASGTILTTTVSLGYDVPRERVERALLAAADAAGLTDPFVQVMELGDFAVTYRAGGLLTEVRHILSARSRLRAAVMDALHGAGVEIVSPSVMSTRTFPPAHAFVPPAPPTGPAATGTAGTAPEDVAFDKADEAASLESLRERLERQEERLAELAAAIKEAGDGAEGEALRERERRLRELMERLEAVIAERERRRPDGSE